MKKQYYFDYASTTPLSSTVLTAMMPYLKDDYYNPSALYLAAKKTKSNLEDFRSQIAAYLQVRPSEIFFTAGSSEANNTIIQGVMNMHKDGHVIASAIEHDSVYVTIKNYNHSYAPVGTDGIVDTTALKKLITDKTVLISCMYANNEIGTVQPVHEISQIIADVLNNRRKDGNKTPLYLHVDASQSFNYISLLPRQLGIDFAVVGGSKIYGPKQTAILYKKAGLSLQPLVYGGGQEYGLRSGTENVAGVAGLACALQEAEHQRSGEVVRLLKMRNTLAKDLEQLGGTINGSLKHRLPNNIHVTFAGVDNETLVMQLDEVGCMVATGSACSASSDLPSHVLKAIGLSDTAAQNSIRITMGRGTTPQDCTYLTKMLTAILRLS